MVRWKNGPMVTLIARKALNLQLADRTGGALYFHQRKATPGWAANYTKTVEIGEFLLDAAQEVDPTATYELFVDRVGADSTVDVSLPARCLPRARRARRSRVRLESRPVVCRAPELLPPETFDWTGEEISFSIPPTGWRREGETSGGDQGRPLREGALGRRGHRPRRLLHPRGPEPQRPHPGDPRRSSTRYDYGFAWDKALRNAYAYTDTPFSSLESEIAERVNREVSQANAAYRNRDRDAAKAHLEAALAESAGCTSHSAMSSTRVEFTPERRQNPEWYHMLGRREAIIAGEPAVIVDYTVKVPERPQHLLGP